MTENRMVAPEQKAEDSPELSLRPLQLTEFIGANQLALFADQSKLVTRHWMAGAAVANFTRALAKVHMQHFRRAETIDDVRVVSLVELFADVGRQTFACRRGDP